jgi:hypothetical protein
MEKSPICWWAIGKWNVLYLGGKENRFYILTILDIIGFSSVKMIFYIVQWSHHLVFDVFQYTKMVHANYK